MSIVESNIEVHKRHKKQKLIKFFLLLITVILFVPVLAIFGVLLLIGTPAVSINFLFSHPTQGMTSGGIFPAIVGTYWLIFLSLLFSCPLGVVAAIYLNEYATDNWFTRIINLAIINLAGVPSIVYSLFGLGAFVLFFNMGTSIIAASLTLSVMNLPVIITSTREALLSAPQLS